MNVDGKLKVAINALIMPGTSGGVSTAVKCLIRDLGKLDDGNEIYIVIVGSDEQVQWLKPVLSSNQQFALRSKFEKRIPDENGRMTLRRLLKWSLRPVMPGARYLRQRINIRPLWPEVPLSDGFYESLGCDVIHFPTQVFTLCALPTIYNPHDLQHLHYPEFWTPEIIAWRETIYPAGCHIAKTVVVGSEWIKDDVVRQYGINPEKVQIIPEGPPTLSYPEPSADLLKETKRRYQLEEPFMLYPSVTWAHKNHRRLMEAIAFLLDRRDLFIRLVCIGSRYERFWPEIEKRLYELKLGSQVRFLGFVPEEDLRPIYRLAQFLIEPSLFEASSLPIFEAWLEGIPITCSNVTALPDQVLDAGLLFDPNSVESIADAVAQMATNKELREEFRSRGFQRLADFDCQRTAKAYRAVYRQAGGFPLTEEDQWLLQWDWMRNPHRNREIHS